jgi:hypothetical protein
MNQLWRDSACIVYRLHRQGPFADDEPSLEVDSTVLLLGIRAQDSPYTKFCDIVW